MRITNSIILRGYNRNLTRLQKNKVSSEHKIMTGRKFDRASEAPLSAAKALNIRKQLYDAEQYKENLEVADKFYTEAETSLLQVSGQMASIRETIIAAVNSYNDISTDLSIYSQQLETKASELCSIFNTDTAERVIFGGESNDPMPFTIRDGMALYHGVPLNAYQDSTKYPYSDNVYIDIGVGMVIDQQTQAVDPQSVLKISFNGADITNSGCEGGNYDINLDTIVDGEEYMIDIYANDVKRTITFTGAATREENLDNIQAALDVAFEDSDEASPWIGSTGVIFVKNGDKDGVVVGMNNPNATATLEAQNIYGYTDNYYFDVGTVQDGKAYKIAVTVGDVMKTIDFVGGADNAATVANINAELENAFGAGVVELTMDGHFNAEGEVVSAKNAVGAENYIDFKRDKYYSNNYIQLTLDAAKALKEGDIEYANGCIDRIVSATENLLLEIANLGCNEEFIEFNIDRFDTRVINLKERQDTLESTDLEEEITMMKTYEALYNACLQMSSSVIPNSIFNYIN